MNPKSPRHRTDRSPGAAFAATLLAIALPAGAIPTAGSPLPVAAASGRTGVAALSTPSSPGLRVPGLEYFRLEPTARDTVFQLLVIPVQFPEDGILGGGSRTDLLEKLNGTTGSLESYYLRETGQRLRIVSTLAPTVVALHDRDYYTVDGGGYGVDPDSYPNNAQRLVEEVTLSLDSEVDFRIHDNTGDGIAEGILILHSGPESSEEPGAPFPGDVLLAHSFTVTDVMPRGGSSVFPYAMAATRDGLGVWAHEVGHLLGLPDLYVASGICPGPGVGEWSLMATGANRSQGDDPTGLDAYSRQLLGIPPVFAAPEGVDLSGGVILRAAAPGAEEGPRYYLVEARESGDGPAGLTPARVVFFVDEDAVDNRSCPLGGGSYRPLVRVAFVACPGQSGCSDSFQESCPGCPEVSFAFEDDSVRTFATLSPPVRVSRVGLSEPRSLGVTERQTLFLTLESTHASLEQVVNVTLQEAAAESVCVQGPLSGVMTLGPGETGVDSTWALVPCSGAGAIPREDLRVVVELTSDQGASAHTDTLTLPSGRPGLARCDFERFTPANLAPGRRNPWRQDVTTPPGSCPPNCPAPETTYVAEDFDRLAHGELVSPWFTVPAGGTVVLDHGWDLRALSADLALDAGQIRLRTQTSPDVSLAPAGGWGFTAERSIGNAFGGRDVLSGLGDRRHAFDVSTHAGEAARVVLVASGDAEIDADTWRIRRITAAPAPAPSFALVEVAGERGRLQAAASGSGSAAIDLELYRGGPAVHPTLGVFAASWSGAALTDLGSYEGSESRFELLWFDARGHGGSVGGRFDLPISSGPGNAFLQVPTPNPVRRNTEQRWSLAIPEGGPFGEYRLRLVDPAGREVYRTSVRIDAPGMRLVPWNGRDPEGRPVSSGVYVLEARSPDGSVNGRRVVVLP